MTETFAGISLVCGLGSALLYFGRDLWVTLRVAQSKVILEHRGLVKLAVAIPGILMIIYGALLMRSSATVLFGEFAILNGLTLVQRRDRLARILLAMAKVDSENPDLVRGLYIGISRALAILSILLGAAAVILSQTGFAAYCSGR